MARGKDPVKGVYELAERRGVGIGEACDLAGIARSTPPRWKRGTKPRPNQIALLTSAINAIADKTHTGMQAGGHGQVSAAGVPAAMATIRRGLDLLETALGASAAE